MPWVSAKQIHDLHRRLSVALRAQNSELIKSEIHTILKFETRNERSTIECSAISYLFITHLFRQTHAWHTAILNRDIEE